MGGDLVDRPDGIALAGVERAGRCPSCEHPVREGQQWCSLCFTGLVAPTRVEGEAAPHPEDTREPAAGPTRLLRVPVPGPLAVLAVLLLAAVLTSVLLPALVGPSLAEHARARTSHGSTPGGPLDGVRYEERP